MKTALIHGLVANGETCQRTTYARSPSSSAVIEESSSTRDGERFQDLNARCTVSDTSAASRIG